MNFITGLSLWLEPFPKTELWVQFHEELRGMQMHKYVGVARLVLPDCAERN